MKKSTIAAVAAAAMFGFGGVSTAMADIEISGFADINYDAFDSDGEEGQFRASGEVDVIQTGDGATFRADFDLINAHNSSPGADLPSGSVALDTNADGNLDTQLATGISVEQVNFAVPLMPGMVTVTAGIWNSPFGMEGQDAVDIHFAANGLLWNQVPSNMAGALATITLNDMFSANLGYINGRNNIAGVGILDRVNDVVVTATVTLMEGVSVTAGFLSDNQQDTGVNTNGDEIDIYANVSLIENLDLAVEWLTADPNTASGGFDSGWALEADYHMGPLGAAIRYEATTAEGVGADEDETSLVLSYHLTDDAAVRVDYTNHTVDPSVGSSTSKDTVTVQLLHTF